MSDKPEKPEETPPEKFNRFIHRLMGVKKRVDPTQVDGPVYGSFHDRMFATVIDVLFIFLIFRDVFDWVTAFVYQGYEPNLGIPAGDPLEFAPMADQVEYVLNQMVESGFVNLWAMNTFIQSLIVGAAVIPIWIHTNCTPGKWLLGLEYADSKTLTPPSVRQYLMRFLGFYISMAPCMLGYAMLGFNKKKQAWHDRMVGTVVVYNKKGHIFRRLWRALKERIRNGGKPPANDA